MEMESLLDCFARNGTLWFTLDTSLQRKKSGAKKRRF